MRPRPIYPNLAGCPHRRQNKYRYHPAGAETDRVAHDRSRVDHKEAGEEREEHWGNIAKGHPVIRGSVTGGSGDPVIRNR